jgi:arylformamidase
VQHDRPSRRDRVTRRALIGSGAAGAVVAAGASVSAQQSARPGREKGPSVWLDLDQSELDDAYTQAVYAPNRDQILARFARNSELARGRLGPPKRFAYGPTAIEGLDVFTTKAANAPVLVFVHGGAWRAGMAKDYAFAAETFVNAGAHHVVLDFINVIEAAGDLTSMAEQVRRGVAWVYRNAQSFGGDPERLYVCGHSSGGHLAGVLLTTDWEKEFNLPPTIVKGGVCASGMYDLKPVRLSVRASYVKFTDAMEQALSSQRHLDQLVAPVSVVYGTLETPEFQRQSRDFAAAIKAAGKTVTLAVAEGYNHFEVMESLGNPYSVYSRATLELMKLVPA